MHKRIDLRQIQNLSILSLLLLIMIKVSKSNLLIEEEKVVDPRKILNKNEFTTNKDRTYIYFLYFFLK